MNLQDVQLGIEVTVTRLTETTGMLIKAEYLERRRLGATGWVRGFVPGHGGDVWWVQQEDGIAAYMFDEFEPRQ